MATNRYVNTVGGLLTQVVPAVTSAGAPTAGQIIATNSAGVLDATMLPAGVGANAVTATASATISAGMLVNIYNNAGVLSVRPADSTAVGSEANGYAPSATANGGTGTVNLGAGLISGLSALTIGTNYYLGTVGAPTTTVPSTAGNIVQYVGKALSATSLDFYPAPAPITVA
jgi:hypothetical protein